MTGFIGLFDTAGDYTLQFTVTHKLVSTVMSSMPLLGNGFQRRTFPYFRVPELSPTSATGFSQSSRVLCYDRRSVGQSVLMSSTHLGFMTRFLLVRQLWVCWCGALSLTRGRVCRLQLRRVLASAVIFGSDSRGTRDHILLSQIWDFHFCRLLRLAGLRWRYSTPPPNGMNQQLLTTEPQ
jgi:hypothetical protein